MFVCLRLPQGTFRRVIGSVSMYRGDDSQLPTLDLLSQPTARVYMLRPQLTQLPLGTSILAYFFNECVCLPFVVSARGSFLDDGGGCVAEGEDPRYGHLAMHFHKRDPALACECLWKKSCSCSLGAVRIFIINLMITVGPCVGDGWSLVLGLDDVVMRFSVLDEKSYDTKHT